MPRVNRPAIRYHGAKFRLASWVMRFFPAHQIYTEVFGGAAGVLLQKPRVYAEVYNDLDGDVVNFWRVMQDPDTRRQLIEACMLTPYARAEFDLAWEPSTCPVERARRLCIRAQMGFGSAGATKGSTGFRVDTKRRYSTAQMDWTRYPEAIAAAGERFTGVLIENRPAIEVLQQHDGAETLHMVDPPYVHETRVLRTQSVYKHEMTDADHVAVLQTVMGLQGFVVLCGYDTDLYNDTLQGWTKHTTTARISAGRGTGVRQEAVWLSPRTEAALQGADTQLFRRAA